MKQIDKGELYKHLCGFLETRGIELKEGSYTKRIEQGCGLLSEAINLGQKGITRAKTEVDEKLDQMRQVIHEKTAPKAPPAAATPPPPKTAAARTAGAKKRGKTPARESRKTR